MLFELAAVFFLLLFLYFFFRSKAKQTRWLFLLQHVICICYNLRLREIRPMISMFCTCTKLLQSWPMICDVYSMAVSLWFVSEKFVFSVVLLQSFWLFCCSLSGCFVAVFLVVLLQSFWLFCCSLSGCFVAVFLVVLLQSFWLFCCSLSGCFVAVFLVVLLQSFWLFCFVAVFLVLVVLLQSLWFPDQLSLCPLISLLVYWVLCCQTLHVFFVS